MMKKVLVILTVLAVASISSAALVFDQAAPLTVNVGETIVLSVSSTLALSGEGTQLAGGVYSASDFSVANLVNPGKTATAGALASNNLYLDEVNGYYGYEVSATNSPAVGINVGAGTWFTFEISGVTEGAFQFDLYDYDVSGVAPVQSITGTVTAVPEPITVALLGLGGLFIRRRK